MATIAQTMETKRAAPAIGLIVAAILAVAGIGAWIYQLSMGMQVTGLGQQVVWGLYIAAFFTAVGAGAGLLFLVGLSEFQPVIPKTARSQILALSLAAFIAAGLLITMDVGNPLNLWHLITAFHFSSMMTWDFWLLVVAGVVGLVYLVLARKEKPQLVLGELSMLASLAVVAVEGWMLSNLAARPLWGSGLTLLTFLLGAAIAGLSLTLLLFPEMAPLRLALSFSLGLSLVVILAEIINGLFSSEPRVLADMHQLVVGSTAPTFWFYLVGGLILPLVLFYTKQSMAAGILAFLGVLAEKVGLLAAGLAEPWLALPNGSYSPSWVEFLAVLGVAAIGYLVYWGVTRLVLEKRA